MADIPGSGDPFSAMEELMARATRETAREVNAWQKAHQITDQGYQLIRRFNEERKLVNISGEFQAHHSSFANTSGLALWNLAGDLQEPHDPTVALGTSQVLLSGLQSTLASYVSAPLDFSIKTAFPETLTVLESQKVPLEDRLPSLSRRLRRFSEHFTGMISGIEKDLLDQSNPLAFSNAAKNLRETLTTFVHKVSPDAVVEPWPDCEVDPERKRPTRRTRLGFHAFLGLQKGYWPEKWTAQVEKRITTLLNCFDELNKFTHINEKSAKELPIARLSLDKFVSEFILYLDTANEAIEVMEDVVRGPIENKLREMAEGDLHPWFEEGASHAYTDDVYCEELRVEVVGEDVAFSGRCRVTGTFQHGSAGDVRRGDGAEWKGYKSFKFCGRTPFNKLDDAEIEPLLED